MSTNSRNQTDRQTQWQKLVVVEIWSELAAGKEQAESSSVETGTPSTTSKNTCWLIDLCVKSVELISVCGSMKVTLA